MHLKKHFLAQTIHISATHKILESEMENCVFDMLRFWKYGLYAFCGLLCLRRKRARKHGYKVVT
jgi:hypothetical protein